MDFADSSKGTMLLDTRRGSREIGPVRLHTLVRGISWIMLQLASKPYSCIGSLDFNGDGSTTLANLPLSCIDPILESESAPEVVDQTYTPNGIFINAMLRFREKAFRAQPNAVNYEEGCRL